MFGHDADESGKVEPALFYRLACSTLHVTGSAVTRTSPDTGKRETERTGDVALLVQADPRHEARVRLPWNADGTDQVSIKQADDGRLLEVSGSAHGLLAEAIDTAATTVAFVGGIVGAVLSKAAAIPPAVAEGATAPPKPKESPLEQWEDANRDGDAQRLTRAVAALAKCHDDLITAAEATAHEYPKLATGRLAAIQAGIAALHKEIQEITARRDAWIGATVDPEVVEPVDVTIPTDEVFRIDNLQGLPPESLRVGNLRHGSKASKLVLERLGLALVDVTPGLEADESTTSDAEQTEENEAALDENDGARAVYWRIARPLVLALYRRTHHRSRLRLDSVTRYWVVDRRSRYGVVRLKGEDHQAAVTFSGSGSAATVTLADVGKLGEVLTALGQVPDKVSAGLTSAKSAADAWSSLSTYRSSQQLAALTRRQQALQAAVAVRGLEADAASPETLQQLKDRLDRITTQKQIDDTAPSAPTAAEAEAAAQKQLLAALKLQLAIAEARNELGWYPTET